MKKPNTMERLCQNVPKFDLKMKLTLFFLTIALFQMKANVGYSQNTKISLDLNKVTLIQVIEEIEKKTEFKFFYKNEDVNLNREITLKIKKGRIDSILNKIFQNKTISYEIYNKHIIIKKITKPKDKPNSKQNIQKLQIKGSVSDKNGAPLPGASVIEKGTANGTQTDFDGNFSITVNNINATLVVSYIGFSSQEVALNEETSINIVLQEDAAGLDEVIVIGYGTQKAKDLTGSVKQISGRAFKDDAIPSSGLALQGRAAGVRVVNNGSEPGSSPTIRIRGTTSRNSNEPLYVIDGQIVSTGLGFLNPRDIESMTVLKDASAAAIYGSRAAAGVILITTKRGVAGKPTIEYSTSYSFDRLTNDVDMLNAADYLEINGEFFTNAGQPYNPIVPAVSGDTNWQDEIFRTGSQQNHHLSIRGGSETNRYAIQTGYFHQEGVLKDSKLDRYNFRVNNDIDITDKLRISSSIDINYANRSQPNGAVLLRALQYPSNVAVQDADGNLVFSGYPIEHPLREFAISRPKNDDFRGLGNISLQYEFIEGLKFKTTFGAEYRTTSRKEFFNKLDYSGLPGVGANNNPISSLSLGNDKLFVWNWDNQISYTKSFGDHNFSALALHTAQASNYESFAIGARDFLTNAGSLQVIDAALDSQLTGGNAKSQWSISSLVGRLTYDFKSKYLLAGSVRKDKSSRIHPDFRKAVFPSVSTGWVLSEESFFNVPFIDRLKIRGGWGEIGNERAVDDDNNPINYPYQSSFTPSNSVIFGGSIQPAVTADRIQNSALEWESTTTTDIGIDASLFDNKLSITADYFTKDTDGIIVQPEITSLFGLTSAFQNTSNVRNSGVELAFTYADDIGNFHFEISPNYTYVKNEVITLSPSEDARDASIGKSRVGRPLDTFGIGYIADGIFQNQAEVDAHATQEPGTAPGDVRFKDLNNDGVIDPDDRDWIGLQTPPHDYGISILLEYKNFDLNVLGVGQSGAEIAWDAGWAYNNFQRANEIVGGRFRNRWHGEGTSNFLPRMVAGDPNNNTRFSSLLLESTDYFRIQNIQLGYTLPENITEKLRMSNLKFYIAGQNLFTFTDFTGYDPQTGFKDYPVANSIYFGVNAKF